MSHFNHKGRPGLVGGSLSRNNLRSLFLILKGSSRSGNFGHAGRKGKRGGSSSSKTTQETTQETPKEKLMLDPFYDWSYPRQLGNTKFSDDGEKMAIAHYDNKGELVGTAVARKRGSPGAWTLSSSKVSEQKKGIGTQMYMNFLKYVYPDPVVPEGSLSKESNFLTKAAINLHKSLQRRSDIKVLEGDRIVYNGEDKKEHRSPDEWAKYYASRYND